MPTPGVGDTIKGKHRAAALTALPSGSTVRETATGERFVKHGAHWYVPSRDFEATESNQFGPVVVESVPTAESLLRELVDFFDQFAPHFSDGKSMHPDIGDTLVNARYLLDGQDDA